MKTPIVFNNKSYKTIKEACNDLNLSVEAVINYKSRNKSATYTEALQRYVNGDNQTAKKIKGIVVQYKNATYRSLTEACTALNVDYRAIRRFMKTYNDTFETAVKRYNKKHKPIVYKNTTYNSFKEACTLLQVSRPSIYYLIDKYNMSFEDAVTKYKNGEIYYNGNAPLKVQYKDKQYESLKHACNDLNLEYGNIYQKYVLNNKHNKTFEEIVDNYKTLKGI